MGFPNCSLSLAYVIEAFIAPSAIPIESAPIEILPPSRIFMDWINPSPIFPRILFLWTRQLSKMTSAVSEALIPNLSSFFPPLKPGVPRSTANAVMPCESSNSPVLAITTMMSPVLPWVMKFLAPLITQWSPSSTAVHFILMASDPVLGSVNPQAPIHSPEANLGNHLFFCSLFPNFSIWFVQSELWAATDNPIDPQTFDISAITAMYSK